MTTSSMIPAANSPMGQLDLANTSAPEFVGSTAGVPGGMTTLSPDALLAFVSAQLGDLDTEIGNQMQTQQTAMREREAVDSVNQVLESFGTQGPQDVPSMQKCVDAFNNAIAQLPAGDPAATQLATARDNMVTKFDFSPAGTPTPDQQSQLDALEAQKASGQSGTSSMDNTAAPGSPDPVDSQIAALQQDIAKGNIKAPNGDIKEWQGVTDGLSQISNDIKDSAQIGLLQLQDLVSQREQVVQQCSGMTSKNDQTLEDQAKAIGR